MKKILFLLAISIFLVSCTQYRPAPINYNSLSKNLVTGMSKSEAIKILGLPKKKKIEGNKETFYYFSKAESDTMTNLLNYTVLLPVGIMSGGKKVIREYLGSSELTLEFDENGKLEKFE